MLKILIRILPSQLKKKFLYYIRQELSNYWTDLDKKIPKYELSNTNVSNLKTLVNREQLLELLPKNGIVAEIGVDKGIFSEKIFKITSPKKLHLIDVWDSSRYPKILQEIVEKIFIEDIKKGRVEINLGLSTVVVDNFVDNYFDWIYIDTDHSYTTTKAELEQYSKKVKSDGIIAGHDFIIGNWNGMVRYGVIEAVYEFCVKNNWEIIYLTMENNNAPSYAIRRLTSENNSNR